MFPFPTFTKNMQSTILPWNFEELAKTYWNKKEGPNIWLAELILRNDKAHSPIALSFVKAVFGVCIEADILKTVWHKCVYVRVQCIVHGMAWRNSLHFYQEIKLGWKKQILHILLSETEIQEGLCFVSFVQTKITGVWWGAKCSAYGTALKFFEIMVQRTFYRKGKWISFSTETIIV